MCVCVCKMRVCKFQWHIVWAFFFNLDKKVQPLYFCWLRVVGFKVFPIVGFRVPRGFRVKYIPSRTNPGCFSFQLPRPIQGFFLGILWCVVKVGMDHPQNNWSQIWLHTRYESRRKENKKSFYVLDYLLELIIKISWSV